MKLRIVMGRAGAGKTEYCLEQIRQRLRENPEGPSLVMVLPEHATFQVEKELANTPGIPGFMRAYIFGFKRLAYRVLQETGGAVRPHISDLGKKLILSRLLKKHQQELKIFHRAAEERNFAETLTGLLREFKAYDIAPQGLAEVGFSLAGTTAGDKLHDLALIYQGFSQFLEGRYTDPEDYLSLVASKIRASEILKQAEVWLDGFTWFNPQEAAVVLKLLETAQCVTITLCLENANDLKHEQETSLFHRQWKTWKKLREWAQRMAIPVEEIELPSGGRFNAPVLRHLEQQFVESPQKKFTGPCQDISIAEGANRRVEVEAIARDILRLCRDEGYRWRDIGILIRDVETYGPLLEQILASYDIPFFSDRKRHPVHHPLAELMRSSLEAIQHWNYEPLFRCWKTDFFMVDRSDIDRLENYVLEFGIKGFRWTNREPWSFVRRLSLEEDAELNDSQQETLAQIHNIRQAAAGPLLSFAEAITKGKTVRDYTVALYGLLETLRVPDKLEEWAERAEAEADLEQALEHRQMWECIVPLLEQLVESCGQEEMTLEEYGEVLEDGLESLTLSLIPPGLDYVTVSPLEETSLSNISAIYIPGVNDGVLPARGRGEGLLTDAERAQILECGMELAPGAQSDTFAEQFLVYTALTRCRQYLWLSYPLADEEGKGLNPSLIIRQVRRMVKTALIPLPAEPVPGNERQYIAHPRASVSGLSQVLRGYKKGGAVAPLWWDVYNWALAKDDMRQSVKQAVAGMFHYNQAETLPGGLAKGLYTRNGRIRGSVTRFESFRACPFKHFAQYGLNLKERAVFRLQAPDLGQFFHAVLKRFGETLQTEGREWGSVSDEKGKLLVSGIVEELAPKLQNEILLSTQQHKHLTGRLKSRVGKAIQRLMEFDRVSRFKPCALEQAFGRGQGSLPPLVFMLPDEIGMEIAGQIDRLDIAEVEGKKYLLVLDYKSGGAWLKLADVYHGLKLQLLTYLLVACQAFPDAVPAGVLYYFLKSPKVSDNVPLSLAEISKKINNLLKMPGWVLGQSQVVQLLDSSIDGYSEFLKIALKKDGEFYSSALPYIKSAEEFTVLLTYIEEQLLDTARRIISGDIAISPYSLEGQSPCGFCPYGSVCQFDKGLEENVHRSLEVPEDKEIMQKMSQGKENLP